MKALVVYESMFGNTEQIARAIAVGLAELRLSHESAA
jgi:flavodoxin